jgi:hypothetical protein
MVETLKTTLKLVGPLDDSLGEDTPSKRLHVYLDENVKSIDKVKLLIIECLNNTGDQYNKALQDLVNHLGQLMGFNVEFGRYRGIVGEIGNDGLWISSDFDIVVEIKTTDVYATKTATLNGYIGDLISSGKIRNGKKVMGLYIYGKQDHDLHQLESAIKTENSSIILKIISIDSLLVLAKLMEDGIYSHEDIMKILIESGTTIDNIVGLLIKPKSKSFEDNSIESTEKIEKPIEGHCYITPVSDEKDKNATAIIDFLVCKRNKYAISDRAAGRKNIKLGDEICFYANKVGIVANARIATNLEKKNDPDLANLKDYPWVFGLDNVKCYFDNPIVLDKELRKNLDGFRGKDVEKSPAWFVQQTHLVTEHDFRLLTRK